MSVVGIVDARGGGEAVVDITILFVGVKAAFDGAIISSRGRESPLEAAVAACGAGQGRAGELLGLRISRGTGGVRRAKSSGFAVGMCVQNKRQSEGRAEIKHQGLLKCILPRYLKRRRGEEE